MPHSNKSQIELVKQLDHIAAELANIKDYNSLCIAIQRILDQHVPVEYNGLYLFDPKSERLLLFDAKGFSEEERLEAERTAMERHPGTVFKTAEHIYVPDTETDIKNQTSSSERSFVIRSRLYLPVMSRDKCVGTFGLASTIPNYFNERFIAILSFVCNLAGMVYTNLIYSETITDNLKTEKELNGKIATTNARLIIKNEELEQSRKKFKEISDSLPQILMEIDTEGTIRYMNNYGFEQLEYESSDLQKGVSILELFTGYNPQFVLKNLSFSLRYDTLKERKYTAVSKTGRNFPVAVFTNRIIRDGNVLGLIVVMSDLTEQVSYEKELKTAMLQAEESSRAKSTFLANMSHEIRTPMNAILGFSEALLDEIENRTHRTFLQSILTSGQNLMMLINDILDLSKIEAGKLTIKPAPMQLKQVLCDIKQVFEEKAIQKNLNFQLRYSEKEHVNLILDEVRLRQILFNLVGNAVKFTHKGYVFLKAKVRKNKKNTIDLYIEVQDTGIGIKKKEQTTIFQAFKQQEQTDSRQYEGTGLGLAITKRLVEKMDGEIYFTSEPNEGSSFMVNFKNIEVSNEVVNKENASNDPQIKFYPARVLIVDDVRLNIMILRELLKNEPFEFLEAESGEEAIETCKQENIDLIFMDLRMQDMTGEEASKEIRKIANHKSTAIIAYTASVLDLDSLDQNVFNAVLKKPSSKNQIYTCMANLLPHSSYNALNNNKQALAEVLKQKYPSHLQNLNSEFFDRWKSIANEMLMYEIEEFIRDLKDFSEKNKMPEFTEYIQNLEFSALNFDIDTLELDFKTLGKIFESSNYGNE